MSKFVSLTTAAAIAALAAPAMGAAIAGSGVGAIPDDAPATDTPGTPLVITFAGVSDAFSSVDIDIDHTWVGDLTAVLSDGTNSVEMFGTDIAGFGDNSNLAGTYSFVQGAGGDFLAAATAAPGTDDVVANGTYTADFSALVASGGDWTLTMADSAGGDPGTVNSATLNTVPEPGSLALLGLGGLALLRRRR